MLIHCIAEKRKQKEKKKQKQTEYAKSSVQLPEDMTRLAQMRFRLVTGLERTIGTLLGELLGSQVRNPSGARSSGLALLGLGSRAVSVGRGRS